MAELHQADAVFQGGGVKGIALVGALLAFAEQGWTEWVSVAGTSAGSIVAGFLGRGYAPADLEKILHPRFDEKDKARAISQSRLLARGLLPR